VPLQERAEWRRIVETAESAATYGKRVWSVTTTADSPGLGKSPDKRIVSRSRSTTGSRDRQRREEQ